MKWQARMDNCGRQGAEVLIQKQTHTRAPSAPSCSSFTPELTKVRQFGADGKQHSDFRGQAKDVG